VVGNSVILLPHALKGRCFGSRATQKGRERLELVSELTALGLKNVGGHGNEQHGSQRRKINPRDREML